MNTFKLEANKPSQEEINNFHVVCHITPNCQRLNIFLYQ